MSCLSILYQTHRPKSALIEEAQALRATPQEVAELELTAEQESAQAPSEPELQLLP